MFKHERDVDHIDTTCFLSLVSSHHASHACYVKETEGETEEERGRRIASQWTTDPDAAATMKDEEEEDHVDDNPYDEHQDDHHHEHSPSLHQDHYYHGMKLSLSLSLHAKISSLIMFLCFAM
jgi:hypothetical protein